MSDETLFLLRVNLDLLATKRGSVRRVRVTGDLSRSERLCQRMADGLACRVERLRDGEGIVTPAYSPSLLLRRRQAPHLRRFARSCILNGQASTPPVHSVAKHPSYST